MTPKIAIVDYGMGNLNSVKRKLERLKVNCIITSKSHEIRTCDKIILPGVGHFQKAMENLQQLDLIPLLNEQVILQKKPILGICLGMQLMAKYSEEGNCKGLAWFDAEVVRFKIQDKFKYKVPHMGWNSVRKTRDSKLMLEIPDDEEFYFVHSYYVQAKNSVDVINYTEYEFQFCSAMERENIFGVQYHPEKSHDAGELLLANFVQL